MDAASVQQMVQQMMQQQAQQLQQQHAAQVQQAIAAALANAAPAAAPAAAGFRGPKLPSPAIFEGAASKLDDFIADIDQQIGWYAVPAAQVTQLAASFMRGAARDWWMTLAAQPADWAAMQAALRARFQPVNSAETARTKLLALVQGKQTINDYIDAFRRLLVHVPTMSADDRFHQFRRGLRPALATQVDVQGITTLDAAINLTARIGGRLEQPASSSGGSGGSSSSHHAPMDLDNIEGLEKETADDDEGATITRSEYKLLLAAMQDNRRRNGTGAGGSSGSSGGKGRPAAGQSRLPIMPHLTPTQVKEYMDAGKCFGCGAKDHTSRGCKNRKVGADGRVSWSN